LVVLFFSVKEDTMNASARTSKVMSLEVGDRAGEIQSLLKLLVTKINLTVSSDQALNTDQDNRQVLLDTNVDGVHCLLVRTAKKKEQTQVALSPRERAIARMVAEGYPNKTIAARLEISAWTVATHLRRIFAKLSVGSRAAMVAHLIENGLLVEPGEK
jgi:two-component system, NarL family, nitrate/nitrite response regulator NarL